MVHDRARAHARGRAAAGECVLSHARHAAQDLERVRAFVYLLVVREAVAAVAAVCGGLFAKVAQDERAQAVRGGRVEDHLAQPLLVCLAHGLELLGREVCALGATQKELRGVDVSGRVEQQAFGPRPVSAGATRLLVVVLERERQVVVGDVAHVALVDAHAKGVRGYHDGGAVIDEVGLVALALLGRQTCVVARGGDTVLAQHVADVLDGSAAHAVDDARLSLALPHECEQ